MIEEAAAARSEVYVLARPQPLELRARDRQLADQGGENLVVEMCRRDGPNCGRGVESGRRCVAAVLSSRGYIPAAVGGSISILLITLPVAVLGSSSRNVMSRGTQKRLNRFRI